MNIICPSSSIGKVPKRDPSHFIGLGKVNFPEMSYLLLTSACTVQHFRVRGRKKEPDFDFKSRERGWDMQQNGQSQYNKGI